MANGGGIVGNIKTNRALARWTLTSMNVGLETEWTSNKATPAKMSRDNNDEASIYSYESYDRGKTG